jgi:hypothetical protein
MTTTAEKKRYEYQPKDDEGRNLGRPQVILYDTQEELIDKLTEQNKSVIKEMRNLKKNNRLGILEKETIPDTAPRFAPPVEFKPTELSVDDRITLARDLTDPLKMEAAFDRLTAAKFGAPVEKIREAITSTQKTLTDSQVRQEVAYFLNNTPEYYACKENFDTIYNWMVRYELEPSREHFAMAFARLSEAGILLQAGGVAQEQPAIQPVIVQEGPDTIVIAPPAPVEEPVVVPPAPAAEEEEQPAYQRINTGLSGTGTTSGGGPHMSQPAGSEITYTIPAAYDEDGKGNRIMKRQQRTVSGLKALDAMDPEEYRARFNGEPGFKEKVNKLLGERKVNPNQR